MIKLKTKIKARTITKTVAIPTTIQKLEKKKEVVSHLWQVRELTFILTFCSTQKLEPASHLGSTTELTLLTVELATKTNEHLISGHSCHLAYGGVGREEMAFFTQPLSLMGGRVRSDTIRVEELSLPLTSCNTLKSGPCISPGKHNSDVPNGPCVSEQVLKS